MRRLSADDSDLNLVKIINKQVNQYLKITDATNICLNTRKTEVLFISSKKKHTDAPLKLDFDRKRLYTTNSAKYLVMKIFEALISKQQIGNLANKLNKAIVS